MTLERLRQKARELHAKTRRQLFGTVAGPLATIFIYYFSLKVLPPGHPVLQPLLAVAIIWSVAGLYFLNRGMWTEAITSDAGFSTGLDFCRREIERRRKLLQRGLLWSLGPILLAIGTLVAALAILSGDRSMFPNGLPFLMMVAAWIIIYFSIRVREQRELKHHLDELDDIERANAR